MKYISKVNDVYCLKKHHKKNVVYKKYNAVAKDFGISLPITRSKVEKNVINYLANCFSSRIVHFPKILNFNNELPMLIMENCNANPISCLKMELFPPIENWKDFFVIIYDLKKISFKLAKQIFDNEIENQNVIRNIMYELKITNTDAFDLGNPNTFCLGDLSTNNVLIGKNKIFIIDFECSHWGYEGYDIGQFLAMLFILCKKNNNISYYKSIINYFKKIISDKNYIKKCFMWREILLPYYNRG